MKKSVMHYTREKSHLGWELIKNRDTNINDENMI